MHPFSGLITFLLLDFAGATSQFTGKWKLFSAFYANNTLVTLPSGSYTLHLQEIDENHLSIYIKIGNVLTGEFTLEGEGSISVSGITTSTMFVSDLEYDLEEYLQETFPKMSHLMLDGNKLIFWGGGEIIFETSAFDYGLYSDSSCKSTMGGLDPNPITFQDTECNAWYRNNGPANSLKILACSSNCICFQQFPDDDTCTANGAIKESCTNKCMEDLQFTFLQISSFAGCSGRLQLPDDQYYCPCTGMTDNTLCTTNVAFRAQDHSGETSTGGSEKVTEDTTECVSDIPTSVEGAILVGFYKNNNGGLVGEECPSSCYDTPIVEQWYAISDDTDNRCFQWPGHSGRNSMKNGVCHADTKTFSYDQFNNCDCKDTPNPKDVYVDKCVVVDENRCVRILDISSCKKDKIAQDIAEIEKELKELEGELEELEDTSMASGGRPSEAWLLIVFCTLGCFSTAW